MQRSAVPVVEKPRARSQRLWLRQALLLWERPLAALLLALAAYTLLALARGPLWPSSQFAYYNYLADALLHGQLHLRLLPPTTYDLSFFGGRYYPYWGPFPALLLLPAVALFGVGLSDIVVTLLIGAANVLLVALLLRGACRAGVVALSPLQRGLLVLFFALGTVHVTLAPHARVWYSGQLIGLSCVLLAYLAALNLRGYPAFVLTSLGLAAALLTRNHLVLAGLWPGMFLLQSHWGVGWRRLTGYILAGLAPVVLAVVLLGAYNWLRFGNPLDNGLDYHQMGQVFRHDYARYGAFHPHYLPVNLFYQYLAYPFPLRPESYMGGSLFLLSPVFFAVLWAFGNASRAQSPSRTQSAERRAQSAEEYGNVALLPAGRLEPGGQAVVENRFARLITPVGLLATVLLVNIPILFLMGTGWVQFGPRYTLDFLPPLLLLTALGSRRWPFWLLALLTAVSVASYLVGTLALGQHLS